MGYLTYANVAQSGRFQARVHVALVTYAQTRRDAGNQVPGEEQVIREIIIEQKHIGSMAWNLIALSGGRTKLDNAVAANTTNGVTDYDAVGDEVPDSDISTGVSMLWKYLIRS
jgi:hypothetical protein